MKQDKKEEIQAQNKAQENNHNSQKCQTITNCKNQQWLEMVYT